MSDYGYLQHGASPGPFRTEKVTIKYDHPDNYFAWYEGKWRKVRVQIKRTFIIYRGEKITIQIEGV